MKKQVKHSSYSLIICLTARRNPRVDTQFWCRPWPTSWTEMKTTLNIQAATCGSSTMVSSTTSLLKLTIWTELCLSTSEHMNLWSTTNQFMSLCIWGISESISNREMKYAMLLSTNCKIRFQEKQWIIPSLIMGSSKLTLRSKSWRIRARQSLTRCQT